MIFEYNLAVPARTPKSAPETVVMPLARGIVHKVEVLFPPGCHHRVLVIIRRGLFQVFPLNPDEQLKGDMFPVSYPTFFPLEQRPYELTAYAWSPDCTFPHNVTIRLGILPRDVLMPGAEAIGILSRMRDLIFGRK